MFRILQAQFLAPDVKRFTIEAPRIAKARLPGQFIIVRVHDRGERVPLTIAAADPAKGTIDIIVQGIGKTTRLLNSMEAGAQIPDVVGPLGKPSEIRQFGTVVVIGGGVGTAIAYPTAVAMKQAGNRVVSILGARTKALLILEQELAQTSDQLFVMTDDGGYGEKGLVTDKLRQLVAEGRSIDLVLAIGPIPMMKAVAEATRPLKIPTVVSLNPIMVDGTGMCGGCRVLVDGKSQFACVDGPEFDAHQVDFAVLTQRNAMYRQVEKEELEEFEAMRKKPGSPDFCRLGMQNPQAGP
ncbi:MAG: sulfide/dihydroorotate dehydrogenase-like FAD/NAD-binding protein [Phycisphaeraceae bacterium]|nr:sulfide/dihydroorotate dehydrogenase-like FAD/NAD-binding protein [Phycisphaeraceae bacterium]